MHTHDGSLELPGANLDLERMPGHWVLARMGKRVLRPGGAALTRQMLDALAITSRDAVVELAPGLGTTTRLVMESRPASYVGIERDESAAQLTRQVLRPGYECRQGLASKTGLDDASATVVFGEAMLTMHTADQKLGIAREAHRILRTGGRYGIHELALCPDDLDEAKQAEVQRALSQSIHVGARPITVDGWKKLLEEAGFEVLHTVKAPMSLLEPRRLIADEGLFGALRTAANVLRTPAARSRVLGMRQVFRKYASNMCAVAILARKKETTPNSN